MSTQQVPLTYEGILELFRQANLRLEKTERIAQETTEQMKVLTAETNLKIQDTTEQMKVWTAETERQFQKTARQIEQTNKDVGGLTSSIGAMIESMVKGNIVEKFQALGYKNLDDFCERKKFSNNKLGIKGEIDLFIENGDVAILVEVKTTLETKDVRTHLDRLEKFRRCVDSKGTNQRRFIGAVAGAVIEGGAAEFALENGLYVIVQSGEAFEILPLPEGFVAKQW